MPQAGQLRVAVAQTAEGRPAGRSQVAVLPFFGLFYGISSEFLALDPSFFFLCLSSTAIGRVGLGIRRNTIWLLKSVRLFLDSLDVNRNINIRQPSKMRENLTKQNK